MDDHLEGKLNAIFVNTLRSGLKKNYLGLNPGKSEKIGEFIPKIVSFI